MTSQSTPSHDTFNCRRSLEVDGKTFHYFSLPDAEANGLANISTLPFSLKVLLENLLRHEDGGSVTADDIRKMAQRYFPNTNRTVVMLSQEGDE